MEEQKFSNQLEMMAGMIAYRQIAVELLKELGRNSRETVYLADIRTAVEKEIKSAYSDRSYEADLAFVDTGLKTVANFFGNITIIKNDGTTENRD